MYYRGLNTVEKVANYVKQQIDLYRKFPDKEQEVIDALTPVFEINSECWPIVIDAGKFRVTFSSKLGKGGMLNLKKMLLIIDEEHYQHIVSGDQ